MFFCVATQYKKAILELDIQDLEERVENGEQEVKDFEQQAQGFLETLLRKSAERWEEECEFLEEEVDWLKGKAERSKKKVREYREMMFACQGQNQQERLRSDPLVTIRRGTAFASQIVETVVRKELANDIRLGVLEWELSFESRLNRSVPGTVRFVDRCRCVTCRPGSLGNSDPCILYKIKLSQTTRVSTI